MLSSLHLNSKTLLGKQQSKKIKNILQSLISSNDSIQFRAPVDWKALNLLDYGVLIKHPMDLGTIVRKSNEEKYIYVQEILDDIQLVWDNCKAYNPPNSWIYNLAQKLERSFKKMVKNYLPHIAITVPGRNGPITKQDKKQSQVSLLDQDQKPDMLYSEKTKFSDKLKLLSSTDLGFVVEFIMGKCPLALKQTGDQSADLLVDNIDANTFKEIVTLVDNILVTGDDKINKRIKD